MHLAYIFFNTLNSLKSAYFECHYSTKKCPLLSEGKALKKGIFKVLRPFVPPHPQLISHPYSSAIIQKAFSTEKI